MERGEFEALGAAANAGLTDRRRRRAAASDGDAREPTTHVAERNTLPRKVSTIFRLLAEPT